MLTIIIPEQERWDERKEMFIQTKETKLCLEHSLVSISKWESKWHKPFLSKEAKTLEETIHYIKCMTITQNVKDEVFDCLTPLNINEINDYISDPMTATKFYGEEKKGKSRVVTSELIYYWMTALNIPPEYQKWHLNRLLTLIQVCNVENSPGKKMSSTDAAKMQAKLNAQRRAKLNSKG